MDKKSFTCFIPGRADALTRDDELWHAPLPETRSPGTQTAINSGQSPMTVGAYLEACRIFLEENRASALQAVLTAVGIPDLSDVHTVQLSLEKHGAFYHPIRMTVLTGSKPVHAVINGAVSEPGRSLVDHEFEMLSMLGREQPCLLPRVYGTGRVKTASGNAAFFTGEWFAHYHEFHVTGREDHFQTVIWESDGRHRILPFEISLPFYREAARILTRYYDIKTSRQIYPWHHAAGDFIVNPERMDDPVRLITVRSYLPVMEELEKEAGQAESILPALLVFFLNLTIKNRLDRTDGTGEPVFLDNRVLDQTISGFLTGLEENPGMQEHPGLKHDFLTWMETLNPGLLHFMSEEVMALFGSDPKEDSIVGENLKAHCNDIHRNFQRI